jgi:beta-lactamase regulating signal transducer with metallopeptidase domain
METFIYYILKASLLLTGFYLVYHFLLQKETFYRANRWFLWLGYLASLVLPLITFVKTVVVEAPTFSLTENMQMKNIQIEAISIDWIDIAVVVYGVGLIFFGLKFGINLMQLIKTIRKYRFQKVNKLLVADDAAIESPFSFFRFLFLNTADLAEKEAAFIFKHEQAHANGYHSLDLLFANLHTVFFWFHPFAWWYQSKVNQNLEYLADEAAVLTETDKTAYQQTLLKSLSLQANLPLVHPFYQSFLKNRIVMMNQRKSPKHNAFKYSLMLPLLTLFFLQFQIETVAQYSVSEDAFKFDLTSIEILITADSKQDVIEKDIRFLEDKTGIDVDLDVDRNSEGFIQNIDIHFTNPDGNKGGLTMKSEDSTIGKNGIMPIKISAKLLENGNYELNVLPMLFNNDETSNPNSIELLKLDSIIPNVRGKNVFVYTKNENAQPEAQDTTKLKILLVVDGKKLVSKLNSDELNDLIDPNRIESINVLKGKQATDKYGAEAKDGAIEITTKEVPREVLENLKKDREILIKDDYPQDAFFMLNGKRSSKAEIEKLNPGDIQSINVLKGKNATDKYGSLGKNGVIEIHTKVF